MNRNVHATVPQSHGVTLSDGSRLVNPRQLGPAELRLDRWVLVNGHPSRVVNMQSLGPRCYLVGLSDRAPVRLWAGERLIAFDVAPPLRYETPAKPPRSVTLSDGSRLINPRQLGPTELELNRWVVVNGRPNRVINMRAIGLTGRLVELSSHAPVHLRAGETLTGFDVTPPLLYEVPAAPPPVPRRRRRAAPGAGPNAPGRRRD